VHSHAPKEEEIDNGEREIHEYSCVAVHDDEAFDTWSSSYAAGELKKL
jgi:hypothetical protein